MDPSLRVVTRTPLQELWRSDGSSLDGCDKPLSAEVISGLLRSGLVEFVIADAGSVLNWIPIGGCHSFWKMEVKPHLAKPGVNARLEDFPGRYFYFASQWQDSKSPIPIVLLERNH
jgi:hypothetical protein